MARGSQDDGPPVGIRPAPGSRRAPPENKRIAARVQRLSEEEAPPPAEATMPLNPGFFMLERMRAGSVAKKRAEVRAKVRG